jgi:hypothetical protein
MKINDFLNRKWHHRGFVMFVYISYVGLVLKTVLEYNKKTKNQKIHLTTHMVFTFINSMLKIYVCLYLIIRWNPFRDNNLFFDNYIVCYGGLLIVYSLPFVILVKKKIVETIQNINEEIEINSKKIIHLIN